MVTVMCQDNRQRNWYKSLTQWYNNVTFISHLGVKTKNTTQSGQMKIGMAYLSDRKSEGARIAIVG